MQRVFTEELARDPDRNQSRAAKHAGAKNPEVQGSRWARSDKVRRYLASLTAEAIAVARRATASAVMEASEILQRLSEHARGDAADFVTIPDNNCSECGRRAGVPRLDLAKAEERGKLHLLKRVRHKKRETPLGPVEEFSLELHDAQRALESLARIHDLFDGKPPQHDSSWWKEFLDNLPVETKKQIWVAQMNANRASSETHRSL